MRLLASTAAILVCAILAAGCNGDESSGGALESSLAYVPPNTPFAVAIDTDVEGEQYQSLEDILGRFPSGDALGRMLQDQIEQGADGVSYEEDVRPLLGNPFVVSATDPASFIDDSEDDDFVAAIQVADSDALDGLIETLWNAGGPPGGWIEVDLGTTYDIARLRLVVAQTPSGRAVHEIFGKPTSGGSYSELYELDAVTSDGQVVEIVPSGPWSGVRHLRIETIWGPSWPAWREIQVFPTI